MPHEHELLRRIERLEKQNRRLRLVGIAACLLAVALVTMAQKTTAKKVTYRTIEAGAVTLKDPKGVVRIKLLPTGIELYDEEAKFAGAIREDISILNGMKASQYTVFDIKGKDRINLAMNGERPSIQLLNEQGRVRTAVGQEAIVVFGKSNDEYNSITSDRVTIRDASASTATLGVTETLNPGTGKQTRTSAATLTLFGDDGKVIWRAP